MERILSFFATIEIKNILVTLSVIAVLVLLNFIIDILKKNLLKRATKKRHISNIEIFSKVLKYLIGLIILMIAIFSYAGSWTGLGLGVGLFSASIGWALQKPITGFAAWVMIVIRRPFDIGDRIVIENVRGDVIDITLTHIYLKEIGGIVPGEESSGRIIMVPNSILFEKYITNYTAKNEYVLDQVSVLITYESNLKKAMKLILVAAKKHTKDTIEKLGKEPYIRTYFDPNGIRVHARYLVKAKNLQKISSDITQEIYNRIAKAKDVRIAYPHTEVIIKK